MTQPTIVNKDLHDRYGSIEQEVDVKVNYCTPHPKRLKRKACIFCHETTSPGADKFKRLAKMSDALVQCGHLHNRRQCPFRMHLSCATFSRPMPNWLAQYSSLYINNGSLFCPDHYCETCFTDGYQQSAVTGDLVKDIKYIRAFHHQCLPSGYTWRTEHRYLNVKPRKEFVGDHIRICEVCGECDKRLVKCSTCVNSYHQECRNTKNFKAKEKLCRSCIFDTQIRIGDVVLVQKNGVFCVAKTLTTTGSEKRKIGFVKVSFFSSKTEEIVAVNSIFRPRPETANRVYLSWKRLYRGFHAERPSVAKLLREANDFRPNVVRVNPQESFGKDFALRPSFLNLLPQEYRDTDTKVTPENMQDQHPSLEITFDRYKGYCVKAKKAIKQGTKVGNYIGEMISVEERELRKSLGKHDKESKCYCFDSSVESDGQRKNVICDGARVQNITAILNHSCEPNCKAMPMDMVCEDFEFSYQVIETAKDIAKGHELTINYQWDGAFKENCYCGKCAGPKKLNWN